MALGIFEIDGDPPLVPVKIQKCRTADRPPPKFPRERLNLNDIGPHIREQHRAGRTRDHLGKICHPYALQGERIYFLTSLIQLSNLVPSYYKIVKLLIFWVIN